MSGPAPMAAPGLVALGAAFAHNSKLSIRSQFIRPCERPRRPPERLALSSLVRLNMRCAAVDELHLWPFRGDGVWEWCAVRLRAAGTRSGLVHCWRGLCS